MTDLITSELAAACVAALISGVAWLWRRHLRHRVRWASAQAFLERLGEHARRAVLATHQTYTEAIRDARADGKLTPEEREEAKRRALEILRSYVGWDDLCEMAGVDNAERSASAAIEEAVAASKAVGLLPRSARGSMRSRAEHRADASISGSTSTMTMSAPPLQSRPDSLT